MQISKRAESWIWAKISPDKIGDQRPLRDFEKWIHLNKGGNFARGDDCAGSAIEQDVRMSDPAMRLAISLLSETHWVAVVEDVDQCGATAGIEMRREAVGKVLATHGFTSSDAAITRVVEFLPDVVPFKPIPINDYSDLAALLSMNLASIEQT